MTNEAADKNIYFLLEEVFQILLEILDNDPFSQKNSNLGKKHLVRLRELLGSEFSVLLAETGCLFFSVLKTTEQHIAGFFEAHNSLAPSQKIYAQLLYVSHLSMSIGLNSEETIDSLIELQSLTTKHNDMETEISNVVEDAIRHLQHSLLMQSNKYIRI